MVTTRSKVTSKVVTPSPQHKTTKSESKTKALSKKSSPKSKDPSLNPVKSAAQVKSEAQSKKAQKSAPAKTSPTDPKRKSPPLPPSPQQSSKAPQATSSPSPTKVPADYAMYTADQYAKFKQYIQDLDEKKIPELKDMLRKNRMRVSGNKDKLIGMISDAKVLGVIPKCPACGGGWPKLCPKTLTYFCSGYLEDVKFINCHKTFAYNEIVRDPWQD